MTLLRSTCIGLSLVITSSIAAGQSRSGGTDQGPANTVIERIYDGNISSWRVVSTRSTSGGRDVTVETVESLNVDGKMSPSRETVTEKTGTTPTTEQTKQRVFAFGADGRRMLLETSETQRDILVNGDTNVSHDTFIQDLNGRTALTSRTLEQTRSVAPTVRQVETTLLVPDPNEALRETTRTQETERRIDPGVVRYDGTQLVRDLNGRWQRTEARSREVRDNGASERLEEQTIQGVDINGRQAPVERTVSRRVSANAREEVVIETHVPYFDRLPNAGSGLALSERLTRTTTQSADGGSSAVEEVAGRNPASPSDPLRVIRRTVTTVRPIGSGRWVTERQVFERDVNGRLQRVSTDTEESSGK